MATKTKLFITDERMLKLMEYVLASSIKDISTQLEFCERIAVNKARISAIRKGETSFTPEQILNASKLFGIDLNWIFGFSDEMYRKERKTSPMQQIKEAIIALEHSLSPKANTVAAPRKMKKTVKKPVQ